MLNMRIAISLSLKMNQQISEIRNTMNDIDYHLTHFLADFLVTFAFFAGAAFLRIFFVLGLAAAFLGLEADFLGVDLAALGLAGDLAGLAGDLALGLGVLAFFALAGEGVGAGAGAATTTGAGAEVGAGAVLTGLVLGALGLAAALVFGADFFDLVIYDLLVIVLLSWPWKQLLKPNSLIPFYNLLQIKAQFDWLYQASQRFFNSSRQILPHPPQLLPAISDQLTSGVQNKFLAYFNLLEEFVFSHSRQIISLKYLRSLKLQVRRLIFQKISCFFPYLVKIEKLNLLHLLLYIQFNILQQGNQNKKFHILMNVNPPLSLIIILKVLQQFQVLWLYFQGITVFS